MPSAAMHRLTVLAIAAVSMLTAAGTASGTVTDPGIGGVASNIGASDGLDALSGSGRYVAVWSPNDLAGPETTAPDEDVFVYDRQTATFVRASVSTSGDEANGESTHASISRNGRYVLFVSSAADLVADDTNSAPDAFVRDLIGASTERVSLDSSGAEIAGGIGALWGVESPVFLSGNGMHVLFSSSAAGIVTGDSNGTFDVFVRDLVAGTTVAVSVNSAGDFGNAASQASGISSDGRFILLRSSADNLVAGDSPGSTDAFVHDRDADEDGIYDESGAGETSIQQVNFDPTGDPTAPTFIDFSGDGRSVALMNGAGVFVRDLDSAATARVDVDSAGNPADSSPYYAVSISDDGRVVAFWSGATNLAASSGLIVHDRDSDENGIFDEPGGMTNDDELSSGLFPSVSGDGQVVFDYYGGMLLDRAPAGPDPDTLTVNKVADTDDGACTAGHCTLREAINRANTLANGAQPDTISFDFDDPADTAAPYTIQPASALPIITDAVVIDGTTEPDFAGAPVVELDGTNAGGLAGLDVSVGPSEIRGLVVNRFGFSGIRVSGGSGTIVAGNYVGTDVTGTVAAANLVGILIEGATNTRVGGTTAADRNVVSGNDNGILVRYAGTGGALIQGNYIGTDVSGTSAVGNGNFGVSLDQTDIPSTIGGMAPGARNVISGNAYEGVMLTQTSGNRIEGNYIGTDASGTAGLGNGNVGVDISSAYAVSGSSNILGGTSEEARNIISDNDVGVRIGGTGGGNRVEGNYIGTDVTGTVDLGHRLDAVILTGAGNVVGGTAAGAGNVLSGNGEFGVLIAGDAADGNLIAGNSIGVDANGAAMGNTRGGIAIADGDGNVVGGSDSGAGNVIAFNGITGVDSGVRAYGAATGNSIEGNSIYGSGALGIDLGADGVTANDTGADDADSGANNLQNYPELTSATSSGGSTTIEGTLDTADGNYRVEFFSTPACDASGNGEGATFLGYENVTVGSTTDFTATLPVAVTLGHVVTATATAPDGSSSEFSACVGVTAGGQPCTPGPGNAVVGASAPADLRLGRFESDECLFLFPEQSQVTLAAGLPVDTSPLVAGANPVLPAGSQVTSYLLHGDKLGASATSVLLSGSYTFPEPVIGIITSASKLSGSDSTVGIPEPPPPTSGLSYDPSGGNRQLEATDTVTVSADGLTVQFDLGLNFGIDEVRVLTGSVPVIPIDLTKAASKTQVVVGTPVVYTLTIRNTGSATVTITALSDDRPLPSACTSLVGRTIVAGSSRRCTYTAALTSVGQATNTASVSVRNAQGQSGVDPATATVTVTKASPKLKTTPLPASGSLGTILKDSATLTGGYQPAGTLTFRLYSPSQAACTGTPQYTETVNVSGAGTYTTSSGFPANARGTWRWTVEYSGDGNNNPATSPCNSVRVRIT